MPSPHTPLPWPQAVSIYSALMGLWVAGSRIGTLQFSWASPPVVGWSISSAAVVAIATFFLLRLAHALRKAPDLAPTETSKFKLREDGWTVNDLPRVVAMGEAAIGPQFPRVEWIKARGDRNTAILRVVRPMRGTGDEICGYLMLYPLTANAARRIQRGIIRSGTDLKPEDMCQSFSRARALYIGMLAGEGRVARAFVLDMVRRKLIGLRDKSHPVVVFGKPATRDGARLLRKFGFKPVPGNEGIFHIEYEPLYAALSG